MAAAIVLVLLGALLALPLALTPGLRGRLTAALGERFDADVEVESLHVSALPRLRLQGGRVLLRPKGRADLPPLITIRGFSAEANVLGVIGRPIRLSRVHLDGLEVNVPPGGMSLDDQDDGSRDHREGGEADSEGAAEGPDERRGSPLIVDDLLAERAVVRVLRSSPGKEPRVWEIEHLAMQQVGADTPWAFAATLTNPTPPGAIAIEGFFGPWNAGQPAATSLRGQYDFRDADLGVFRGIKGILHSTGSFQGALERIEVAGNASVPEFALADVGHPVPLTTTFRAVVDGTNGDTRLEQVEARLGKSPVRASGAVLERDGEEGRAVELDVVMEEARIEDVLRLAVKSRVPPLAGGLTLKTKFVLPSGDADALRRIQLDGSFAILKATFLTGNVQGKVEEFSQKARDDEGAADRVASDFSGRFDMRGGVIRFSTVTFTVPGARVGVEGRYTASTQELDFRGTVRIEAKLSQMTTGIKSFLLKAVDPIFRRKDVTVIPVTIRGTADEPDVGLDVGRAITRK